MQASAALAISGAVAALFAAALAPVGGAAEPQRLIASTSACPGQTNPDARAAAQERAMRCLVNFARRGRGRPAFGASGVLARAADRKSADILRCDSFSHEACGRPFTYWIERFGYPDCGAGENIAWGSGRLGSVRSIFRSWMRSQGHRENILGAYDEIGVGLRVGPLEGFSGAHVWTQNFGSRC